LKIYTKTGDGGQTGLVGGSRTSKDSARICAIGEVDELNAVLGLTRCHSAGTPLEEDLSHIQNWLFDLGAELATPSGSRFVNQAIGDGQITYLEQSIDRQTEQLPPLRQFILPGGSELAAHLHLARAVCRRAERELVRHEREEPLRSEPRIFLNRLSDWLFVSARTANALASVKDVEWKKSEE
jgi:cob(I)alamin adenosyltransferase